MWVRRAATQAVDLLELSRQNIGPDRAVMDSPRTARGVDQEDGGDGQNAPSVRQARPSRGIDLQNLQCAVVSRSQLIERRLLDRLARGASRRGEIQDGRPAGEEPVDHGAASGLAPHSTTGHDPPGDDSDAG